jgi:hypothetical protein
LGAPFEGLALLAAVDNPASFYATGENRAARRVTLAAEGYDAARIAEAFAPLAPSSHRAPLPADRLSFAIPRHDGVVPADAQEAWHRAWGGSRVDTSWHGHGTAIASPAIAAGLARKLR